jgi:TetR/AcrR family transcriptional repressor of nem operon
MAQSDTKNRIIDTCKDIIAQKGYHRAGINEILASAGIPKGSFYFYFKNKEEFGLSVMEDFASDLLDKLDGFLSASERPPLHRLARFFGFYHAKLEDRGYLGGSAIGNLALEMSDESELIRKAIQIYYEELSGRVTICLNEARAAGQITDDIDTVQTADFIINSWEGAILRAKVSRESKHLRLFEQKVFGMLLK